ncbi:amino acid ABC transporter permease [Liquorilactobacillus oeni]|uniref:Amino acid ABC superfamily ATP binding cassette transporter, membrane protein n=1 Tax=Liquorilactobacillus oeni DSM 19972 TaxID=1423777 RepID=A0A0R1MBL0_9LACO|nr:amino acid ABC transporter permease [Liquorilactobacillus oeni]KRL05452.1 amino acid ABC superfamily ATP binding cassette transporter, membrane protein [Liquorilactobacillus oeni DSM 19972]
MNLFDPTLAIHSLPTILSGLPLSLILLAVCFITSNIVGVFIVLLRINEHSLLRLFARFYISFFRGVPILVILFLTYFGANMDAIPAAILSMTLVSSAFIAEYYRSALIGINKTQYDAARALGLSNIKTMQYVILPQAFRIVLPSLGNVLLDMFKGTSLAAMITVSEMFMKAKIVAGASQDYMTIYIVIAFIYWLVCCGLSALEQLTEQRLHH